MKLRLIPNIGENALRFGEVVGILTKYGLAEWLSRTEFEGPKKWFTGREGENLAGESRAVRIRLAATELGTTFIKLGQMFSTRPDVVGEDVAAELAKLQEHAPPDSPAITLKTIERELGKPARELFRHFDPKPVASASIGQAHEAVTLKGQSVIVKIQHPDIAGKLKSDLEILEALAVLAENYKPLRRYQASAFVKEFRRSLLRELDFAREQRNLEEFAANFSKDKSVRFPAVFPELSTSRILTMEKLTGANLHEAAKMKRLGYDRDELARRGAFVWMEMIFRDGFYHADPHPGNILILPEGVIGILDCGMVDRIGEELRENVEDILGAIGDRDAPALARKLMRLCDAPAGFDEAAFTAEIGDFIGQFGNQELSHFHLGNALGEIGKTVARGNLMLPSSMSRLIKVFVMLEGTARLLSPSLNLMQIIAPYKKKILLRRLSPKRQWKKISGMLREWQFVGEKLPRLVGDLFQQVQTGKFEIHLEHRRLEPAVNRLVMGMIASALFLGSAILWSFKVPPIFGGYSVIGVLGCLLSALLGLRLIWKIWRNE